MSHPAVARPVVLLMAALYVAAGCHRPASASRLRMAPVPKEMAEAADAIFECAVVRVQGQGFVLVTIDRKKRVVEAASEVVSVDEVAGGPPRDIDRLYVYVGVRSDSARGEPAALHVWAQGETWRVRAEGSYDNPQYPPHVVNNPILTSGRVASAARAVGVCNGSAGTQ